MITIITLIFYIFAVIMTILGFITICRAAACIINEHEKRHGQIRWKWFFFIDKNYEKANEAKKELDALEEEINEKENFDWSKEP